MDRRQFFKSTTQAGTAVALSSGVNAAASDASPQDDYDPPELVECEFFCDDPSHTHDGLADELILSCLSRNWNFPSRALA